MPKPQSRMESNDHNPWIVGCELTRTNYHSISNAEANISSRSDSLEQRGNGRGVSSREQVAASLNVKSGHRHSPNPNLHLQPPSSISQTFNHPNRRPRRRRRPHRHPRTRVTTPDPNMTSVNTNGAPRSTLSVVAIPRGAENLLTHSTIRSLFPDLTRGMTDEDVAARIRACEQSRDRSYGMENGNEVQNPRCGGTSPDGRR